MNLDGRVIVVTGASTGIGLAVARALIAKGSIVYGIARRRAVLDRVHAELGKQFRAIPCDVRHEDAVRDAFAYVLGDAERLDVLVNNAGLGRFGPVADMPADRWHQQMDTNLTGVFFCTREVIPAMRTQNRLAGFGGHIVNIASIAGIIGNANLSAYNATKFGLRGFSEALMKELRTDGIKVTSICPGSVGTDFQVKSGSRGSPNPMHPDDIAATVVHVLESPTNYLISEVVMRPLRPRG